MQAKAARRLDMAQRFKFECVCGQHLVANRSMAGTNVHCPACMRELTVPVAGEDVAEGHYEETERYALTCPCGYRMLVKSGAAGEKIHCPVCRSVIRVPSLDLLRKDTKQGLEAKLSARDRLDTEDLLLLIDDDEGPGSEIR
jgi:hypothetical protein